MLKYQSKKGGGFPWRYFMEKVRSCWFNCYGQAMLISCIISLWEAPLTASLCPSARAGNLRGGGFFRRKVRPLHVPAGIQPSKANPDILPRLGSIGAVVNGLCPEYGLSTVSSRLWLGTGSTQSLSAPPCHQRERRLCLPGQEVRACRSLLCRCAVRTRNASRSYSRAVISSCSQGFVP